MGSRGANRLPHAGHSSLDLPSLPSRRPQRTQFGQEFGPETRFHALPTSRSSLSPLQRTTHTRSKASNKGKHGPTEARRLQPPVHTCRGAGTAREPCGLCAPRSREARARCHPGVQGCAHKEPALGWPAVRAPARSQRRPGSSTPSGRRKGAILYATRAGWQRSGCERGAGGGPRVSGGSPAFDIS